jgi:tetratricopeptide (TPR) repeat protein
MSLPRKALIAAIVTLVATGVWLLQDKETLDSASAEPKSAAGVRPRSAADIIPKLKSTPKQASVPIKDMLEGKIPKLSRGEVETFLKSHGRSPANLIVASRLLNDVGYAREAAAMDPANPMAQLEIALAGENAEEKARAIAAFRKAAPANSLGDYLAANQAFESGDTGAAGAALLQSLEKPLFADYSRQLLTGTERAYLEAGFDAGTSSGAAIFSQTIPQAGPLMKLSKELLSMRDHSTRTGDFDAAEPAVRLGLAVGQRFQDQGPNLIHQLIGITIERQFLERLDPLTTAGPGGQRAGERIETLNTKAAEIRALGESYSKLGQLAPAIQSEFLAMLKSGDEPTALRWLTEQK